MASSVIELSSVLILLVAITVSLFIKSWNCLSSAPFVSADKALNNRRFSKCPARCFVSLSFVTICLADLWLFPSAASVMVVSMMVS
jgi:hypothetical protein